MMMKRIGLAAAVLACASVPAVAQEHWTEGPVWQCDAYRTAPGQFDTYLKYIRATVEPQNIEAKKQGLILDYKTFVKAPNDANDYDVLFCTLFPNYGKALDFDQADEDKRDAIAAAHFKTADEDAQAETIKPRLEMRKYLGTTYVREVSLRPAQ
ncbi:MAG TPA: hypothetical protein VJL86_03390 [Steroidobacteraceae bacterium]|nr:hypothetical protein [Steroidobacteraceae bacterium]